MGAGTVINLHAHTTFSDGLFSPEQIVGRAAADGLTHIAITDHFETAKVSSLRIRDLDRYLSSISTLKAKYEGTIAVLAGIEIDTNSNRSGVADMPFEKLGDLDLVLFEYVNDPASGGMSLEEIDGILDHLTAPCGLAHADIERCFRGIDPKDVARSLQSRGLFVELNTALPYRRNGHAFYELAVPMLRMFGGKVRLSIGTDVHRNLSEVSNVGAVYEFVRRAGLDDDLLF